MMKAGKNVDPTSVGRVPEHAHGYPIIALVSEYRGEQVWCPCCANLVAWEVSENEHPVMHVLTAFDVHWEGEPLECERCGIEIESAYGPVDS